MKNSKSCTPPFITIARVPKTIAISFYFMIIDLDLPISERLKAKGKYFGGNSLFIPPPRASSILFLQVSYNLNFGVIPTLLEKILNLAPLKCLEMLPNRPDMWKLSD